MIKIGDSDISTVKIGDVQVKKIYTGSNLVWQVSSKDYFYFEAVQDGSTVSMVSYDGPSVTLEVSTDKNTWSTWDKSSITLANAGDRIYMRGVGNSYFATGYSSNYNNFTGTGSLKIGGDILTLLDKGKEELTDDNKNAFACLFDSCTALVDASGISLVSYAPYGAYSEMFCGCSQLTGIPYIDIDSADDYSFYSTFTDCTSLTGDMTILYSGDVSKNIFKYMFDGEKNTINRVVFDMRKRTSVPTLGHAAWMTSEIYGISYSMVYSEIRHKIKVVVPDDLASAWRTSTNWSILNDYSMIRNSTYWDETHG